MNKNFLLNILLLCSIVLVIAHLAHSSGVCETKDCGNGRTETCCSGDSCCGNSRGLFLRVRGEEMVPEPATVQSLGEDEESLFSHMESADYDEPHLFDHESEELLSFDAGQEESEDVNTLAQYRGYCYENCLSYTNLGDQASAVTMGVMCQCDSLSYDSPPVFLHDMYFRIGPGGRIAPPKHSEAFKRNYKCISVHEIATMHPTNRLKYLLEAKGRCERLGCNCTTTGDETYVEHQAEHPRSIFYFPLKQVKRLLNPTGREQEGGDDDNSTPTPSPTPSPTPTPTPTPSPTPSPGRGRGQGNN